MRVEAANRQGVERKILTAMIVSKPVLSRIRSVWGKEGLFSSKESNLIAKWCIDFYNSYNYPPGKSIQDYFTSWAENSQDESLISLIDKFLSSLSEEYESLNQDVNPDLTIDLAGKYFNKVKLGRLADSVQGDLLQGDTDKAESRIHSYKRVEVGVGSGIDVFSDFEAVKNSFNERSESLVKYPEALGEFYGDSLSRGNLIAYMGPQKRGKSWILIDLAWNAVMQRRKVAFFEVGDLTTAQMGRRFGVRGAMHPLVAKTVKVPTSLKVTKGKIEIEYEERTFKKGLTPNKVIEAFAQIPNRIKSKESHLKLSCSPAGTITVPMISDILDRWNHESDWFPDLVIIDYADILAPLHFYKEKRDGINDNWIAMRAMAAQRHCLVVTATQANAQSYKASTLGMHHFSEDNRKLSHVSGMIGLCNRPSEKKLGMIRKNWIVRREEESQSNKCVYVAGCLSIGNPCMISSW